MATNSFKQLEEEEEKQFPHAPPEIENSLMGSMRMTHFVGDVIELYLPRLFNIVFAMFGGNTKDKHLSDPRLSNDTDDSQKGDSKTDR